MKILTLIDKSFFLQNSELFSSLDMDHLLLVADRLELLYLKKEESVFFLDDSSSRMYLIVEGCIEINLPDQKSILLDNKDFFGEEGLFSEEKRRYSAKAKTSTTLLALAKGHLFALIQEYPDLAINLLGIFSKSIPFRPRRIHDHQS